MLRGIGGIRMAEGQYVCVWNVDDIRFPESLSLQAATLDENPDILLTYCDFHHMYQYGCISDEKVINEDFLLAHLYFLFPIKLVVFLCGGKYFMRNSDILMNSSF